MEDDKGELLPPIAKPKTERQGSTVRGSLPPGDDNFKAPSEGGGGDDGSLPSIKRQGTDRSGGGGESARDATREGVDPVAILSDARSTARKGSRQGSARGSGNEDTTMGGETTDYPDEGGPTTLPPSSHFQPHLDPPLSLPSPGICLCPPPPASSNISSCESPRWDGGSVFFLGVKGHPQTQKRPPPAVES